MFIIKTSTSSYDSNQNNHHPAQNFTSLAAVHHFCQARLNFAESTYRLFYEDTELISEADFQLLIQNVVGLSLTPIIISLFITDPFFDNTVNNPDEEDSIYCSANLKISKWLVLKELGKGAFGQVCLAMNKDDRQCWAVKTSRHEKSEAVKQINNEVELQKMSFL